MKLFINFTNPSSNNHLRVQRLSSSNLDSDNTYRKPPCNMVKHSESGPITSSSNWGWTQEHARNTPEPATKKFRCAVTDFQWCKCIWNCKIYVLKNPGIYLILMSTNCDVPSPAVVACGDEGECTGGVPRTWTPETKYSSTWQTADFRHGPQHQEALSEKRSN